MAKARKKTQKAKATKHQDQHPQEKNCEQIVNVCCSEQVPEYHYIEPKHEYCCYEIAMKRMRVTKTTLLDGKLELMISGYANQHEAVFPGLGSWFVVSKKWGWVNINKPVGEFKIKKGSPLIVQLGADAIENDIWLGGSAEIGSNEMNQYMKIGCGTGVSNKIIQIDLHAVKNGKVRHKIEIEFAAYEKTCCC